MYIRPTRENLELIKAEVQRAHSLLAPALLVATRTDDETSPQVADPRFSEYHLFFSNIVPNYFLQQLADADEHEVIRQVQEFYGDFMAINEDLFTINQRYSL